MSELGVERVTEVPAPPARPDDSHKGTFGRVLIIAGSRGMSGAACLSGLGALRGGAGLVYVAVPESILEVVAGCEPSYLTIPLADDSSGRIAGAARKRIDDALPQQTAVAIGPGLGRSDALDKLVGRLYGEVALPMVVDADGLNALSVDRDSLADRARNDTGRAVRILTPHPGEFARLAGVETKAIAQDRERMAISFAADHHIILVLKGHHTLVTDGHRLYENTTGNSGMATGGTGDVLTGLITALLAQQMPAFDAAVLGVWLHGTAGDLAAKDMSRAGLIASDLSKYLPHAWKRYRWKK